jgi:hypothetical protein
MLGACVWADRAGGTPTSWQSVLGPTVQEGLQESRQSVISVR